VIENESCEARCGFGSEGRSGIGGSGGIDAKLNLGYLF